MRDEGYRAVDVVSQAGPSRPRRVPRQVPQRTHARSGPKCVSSSPAPASSRCTSATKVYEVLCEQGDLIWRAGRHAALIRHGSESPYFVAIRLFTNPAGWVAESSPAETSPNASA